jgi:hypothetical protein
MQLWHGDCIERMAAIPDKSIDMILTLQIFMGHGDPAFANVGAKVRIAKAQQEQTFDFYE